MGYKEITFPSSTGLGDIFVREWLIDEPKAIIQIVHGMAEHGARYEEIAEYFNSQGFSVVIDDHMGHGKSIPGDLEENQGFFGEEDGDVHLVEDEAALTDIIKEEFPNVPVILFGHSMGSFIARRYTFKNRSDDDFVIFDKELVVGFKDEVEKAVWNEEIIDSQKKAINTLRAKSRDKLSEDIKPYYGEFDFMGLSWDGDLIIMELKKEAKGTKSSLSPIQIAYYVKQFTKLINEDLDGGLYKVIRDMILQKQRMGLIKMTPKAKSLPNELSGKIRKYIIMGDDEKVSKSFKEHFVLAKKVFLENDLEVFTCDKNDGTLRLSSQFI